MTRPRLFQTFLVTVLAVTLSASLCHQVTTVHGEGSTVNLKVSTIPRTRGVTLRLDNSSLPYVVKTDQAGTALFSITPGEYQLVPAAMENLNGSSRVLFERWGDLQGSQSLQASRSINIPADLSVILLVRLEDRISMAFTDQDGQNVDNALVHDVTVKASEGHTYPLRTFHDLWFPVNRFQQVTSGWKVIYVTYTVSSASVMGRDVVQRGLNVFTPRPATIWSVPLQIYQLKVIVSDLFFNFPVDGKVRILDLSGGDEIQAANTRGGETVFQTFPKGDYQISVSGWGIAAPAPIIFTQPMSVEIRVFSFIDASVLASIVAGVLIFYKNSGFKKLKKTLRFLA